MQRLHHGFGFPTWTWFHQHSPEWRIPFLVGRMLRLAVHLYNGHSDTEAAGFESLAMPKNHRTLLLDRDHLHRDGRRTHRRRRRSSANGETQSVGGDGEHCASVADPRMCWRGDDRPIAFSPNCNVCMLSLADPDLKDDGLRQAMQRVPKRSVICLEDCDSVFNHHREKQERAPPPSSPIATAHARAHRPARALTPPSPKLHPSPQPSPRSTRAQSPSRVS